MSDPFLWGERAETNCGEAASVNRAPLNSARTCRPWRTGCGSRNRQTDVVNFTFDRHNRLIGRIEHPANTLDAEELFFYFSRLAIECDRLEYLLTGKKHLLSGSTSREHEARTST